MKDFLFIQEVINNYSPEAFDQFKEYSNKYLHFYYINYSKASKGMLIEKMLEYINAYKIKNEVKDTDIMDIVTKLIDNKLDELTEKNSRAYKYYLKTQEISENIKKNAELPYIETYIRLFISLYSSFVEKNKPIKNFDFGVDMAKYDFILEDMKSEEKGKDVLFVHNKSNRYDFKKPYSKSNLTMLLVAMYYIRIIDTQIKEK